MDGRPLTLTAFVIGLRKDIWKDADLWGFTFESFRTICLPATRRSASDGTPAAHGSTCQHATISAPSSSPRRELRPIAGDRDADTEDEPSLTSWAPPPETKPPSHCREPRAYTEDHAPLLIAESVSSTSSSASWPPSSLLPDAPSPLLIHQ